MAEQGLQAGRATVVGRQWKACRRAGDMKEKCKHSKAKQASGHDEQHRQASTGKETAQWSQSGRQAEGRETRQGVKGTANSRHRIAGSQGKADRQEGKARQVGRTGQIKASRQSQTSQGR